jgi:predicted transcriptional regulator
MSKLPSLGEQEMEILRFISQQAGVSVRDVSLHFEKERNLARTTVLTVMERLRKKGYLSRTQEDGIYKYSAKVETGDIVTQKVSDFIDRTLNGSVSPLINYFISSSKLTPEEIEQLKNLASKLEKEF